MALDQTTALVKSNPLPTISDCTCATDCGWEETHNQADWGPFCILDLGFHVGLSRASWQSDISLSPFKRDGYFISSFISSNLQFLLPLLHLFLTLRRWICLLFHWENWRIYMKTKEFHHIYPTIRIHYTGFLTHYHKKHLHAPAESQTFQVCALDPVSSCLPMDITAAISPLCNLINFSLCSIISVNTQTGIVLHFSNNLSFTIIFAALCWKIPIPLFLFLLNPSSIRFSLFPFHQNCCCQSDRELPCGQTHFSSYCPFL